MGGCGGGGGALNNVSSGLRGDVCVCVGGGGTQQCQQWIEGGCVCVCGGGGALNNVSSALRGDVGGGALNNVSS